MTTKNPTRAGFYPRVSRTGKRSRADLERHTLKQQRALAIGCLPRAVAFVEDERYVDENVSGTHSNRPGLDAIFADVESGRINAVVVGYLSRFGRNAKEALENLERLLDLGATLFIAREGLVVRPKDQRQPGDMSEVVYTIFAAFAQLEAERLADGLADANGNAIADGVSITVPYGYMRDDGPGSVLVFDELDDYGPSPYSVVVRIFELRLDGWGASAIAKLLNDEGVPTPSQHAEHRGRRVKQIGKRWQPNTIQGIVSTHTYKGVIPRWQTEQTEKGKRRRRVPGTLELLPAQHAPVVDELTWQRAQFTGERPARSGSTSGALLKGLVRCASCSQTMKPSSTGRSRGGTPALNYQCRGTRAGCTHPASISRGAVDDYVDAQIRAALGNGGYGVAVVDADELDELTEQITHAEHELAAYRDGGDATEPDFWPGVRARRARIDELEREAAELARAATKRPAPTPEVYDSYDVDEKRDLLSDLLDAVVIRPAPGRGRMGRIEDRVAAIVPAGQSPIELSGSGRPRPAQPFPLVEAD